MSDESQYIGRPLRAEETVLLATLLRTPMEILDERLKTSVVEDMADGGMGSIRFWQGCGQSRSFGKAIAEAEYVDADGAESPRVL